jgi:hypothetical protein
MMNPSKKLVWCLGRHWLEEEATLKAAGLKDAADNIGGWWLEMVMDTPKKRNMADGSIKTLRKDDRTEERIKAGIYVWQKMWFKLRDTLGNSA